MTATVHIAAWATPEGDLSIAVEAPYSPRFVGLLRDKVPNACRFWWSDLKIWTIDLSAADELRIAIGGAFGAQAICEQCASGTPCPYWGALDARARRLGSGQLAGDRITLQGFERPRS